MLKKQYHKTQPLCKVTFSLPIDAVGESVEIRLLGDFNNWSWEDGIVLKPGKTDYTATLELPTGRDYEFRYLANGITWLNDYQADAYVPSPFPGIDNSVVHLKAAVVPTANPKAAPKKKVAPKKAADTPRTTADDLKKIEGIGPKIEQLMHAAGITTFEGLAKASKKVLTEILSAAGPRFRMHDPTTWTRQAALAAKGQWDKLRALQDELKGGREK